MNLVHGLSDQIYKHLLYDNINSTLNSLVILTNSPLPKNGTKVGLDMGVCIRDIHV